LLYEVKLTHGYRAKLLYESDVNPIDDESDANPMMMM
jgi:hypothetical protein